MIKLLTKRENEIIRKKLCGRQVTQNESNILSTSVRPKLRAMREVRAETLLKRLEYNQKARSIESKIKKLIVEYIEKVQAIVLYGSAIQTNYTTYNDIDVLIVTKKRTWVSQREKYCRIAEITALAGEQGLNLDIQIVDKQSFDAQCPHNPSLIYQLNDCKIIYGAMKIPSKVELSKLDLRMKLDWSDIGDAASDGPELYQSLRNVLLVQLLMKRIVDNDSLRETVGRALGDHLLNRLKTNTASPSEKKLILRYIEELSERTDKEIRGAAWEKLIL